MTKKFSYNEAAKVLNIIEKKKNRCRGDI